MNHGAFDSEGRFLIRRESNMQRIEQKKEDDHIVSLERRRSRTFPFSPLLLIDGFSRRSFSYNKLPEEPLKLSVHKLDGTCFGIWFSLSLSLTQTPFLFLLLMEMIACTEIEVPKRATVADLNQAVESAFSHVPKRGPEKISWYCFNLVHYQTNQKRSNQNCWFLWILIHSCFTVTQYQQTKHHSFWGSQNYYCFQVYFLIITS